MTLQQTFSFMATNPVQDVPERVLSAYDRAFHEEMTLRRSESWMWGGTSCSCSYYTHLPCQHRAQLELFDTHGPNCVERGRTGGAYARGTLSHALHEFQPTNSFALRHRLRLARPSWVAELMARPYVAYPIEQRSYANRQRY